MGRVGGASPNQSVRGRAIGAQLRFIGCIEQPHQGQQLRFTAPQFVGCVVNGPFFCQQRLFYVEALNSRCTQQGVGEELNHGCSVFNIVTMAIQQLFL